MDGMNWHILLLVIFEKFIINREYSIAGLLASTKSIEETQRVKYVIKLDPLLTRRTAN